MVTFFFAKDVSNANLNNLEQLRVNVLGLLLPPKSKTNKIHFLWHVLHCQFILKLSSYSRDLNYELLLVWFSDVRYSTSSPVLKWHSNTQPFGDQTTFNHLNIRLVRCSDTHCTSNQLKKVKYKQLIYLNFLIKRPNLAKTNCQNSVFLD